MKALDFEFDSLRLSDFGMVLAKFSGGGIETIDGAEITFNTVSMQGGVRHELTSVEFADCLTFTLQIFNNLCDSTDEEISLDRARDIARWLSRKSFHKFRLLDDEYSGIYFMCSFNVSRIEIDGRLVGFELNGITNAPYGFYEDVIVKLDVEAGEEFNIYNRSDLEGYIYPDLKITIKRSGDFEMCNKFENRTMKIKNCKSDETITINYPMISSDKERPTKIQNDFDWTFFRLASTFKDRLNKVTTTLPCSIELTYSPIAKVGI